ncbi:copper radical oxidase [Schizopora paradoxa]|uniref:Copper radical oxidase n=1 Tax=Schizopora paradoxa TaxID=27342 RepID=A0A0H2SN98_9AGAM|nr:copper radical oxidase [Schizopora paradoxa]
MLALVSLTLLLFPLYTFAKDSAWNGHLTPGSNTPSRFTPYYVPDGSTAYDSLSPAVDRAGDWYVARSSEYINGSTLATTSRNASLLFSFKGTGVEIYGGVGKRYGSMDIYLDREFVGAYSVRDSKDRQQQLLFFSYDLASTPHQLSLVNKGSNSGSLLDIDAFVGVPGDPAPAAANRWSLVQRGSTGVAAMQLAIISSSLAIIIDKVEHNPLAIDGHPAWGALYYIDTHAVQPLNLRSNSFCAGGTFLSNGTLVNVGGNPVVGNNTAAADFGDLDGLQAVRLFHPCDSESAAGCDMYENHARIRLASPRWYNTVLRLPDGSAMIMGGSKKGGWINNATVNNPTIEYYPPKDINGSKGLPVQVQFFVDSLNSNLFPIAFVLPDGTIFIAANNLATIYSWQSNTERRLPAIPNGVRVTYPMAGTGLLLPLSPANGYEPEILLCGGSSVSDTKPGYEISANDPASAQCARMVLTDAGIAAGWQTEQMPAPRIMPDAILLPTGEVLIVNGGRSGIAGYGNVRDQVGQSNAANPVFQPVLYDPSAPSGSRFSSEGLPTSDIPRLYHSVATLTPRGDIMIAGSNPNLDRSEQAYGTEYRVEWLQPPYLNAERPVIQSIPNMIKLGETVKMTVHLPANANVDTLKVSCMDLGFVTHAVHANSRLVYLVAKMLDGQTLEVTGPPNANVYPPGPAWIYLVVDGIPSIGTKVMIGDGQGPVVDTEALNYMLEHTQVDQYDKTKKGGESDEE